MSDKVHDPTVVPSRDEKFAGRCYRGGLRRISRQNPIFWTVIAFLAPGLILLSLSIGRYLVPPAHVFTILLDNVLPLDADYPQTEESVVELVRLPRIIAALLAGGGLALSGAALQGVFRNPLVGPQIIGVSSGAAFGGALAILLIGTAAATVTLAFFFGLVAIVMVYLLSRVGAQAPILLLVLSGVVTSAFFVALTSAIKYVADPEDVLPAIVYWLMGSLASISWKDCLVLFVPLVGGSAVILGLRFRIDVLSLGDDDAQISGLALARTRWLVLVAVALISAAVVSVAGVIGWIGLVVPHFARMLVGPGHAALLPATAALGALYLLMIDNVARTATAAEIPLGILTALIGTPVFAILLRRAQLSGWRHD